MSLSDLAAIGSFVSGVAVLVSLIYLGLQVRQYALAQRATARQSVQAFMRQHQRMLMDSNLAAIFLRGLGAEAGMTDVELMQFHAMVRDWLSFHEESFWLNSRGMLDDDGLKTANAGLGVLLRYPGFRAAWRLSRFSFSKGYGELVDAEARAAQSQGMPLSYLEGWKAAITAELPRPTA